MQDILINNATQTIRRPAAYYRHLLPAEAAGAATIGNSRTAVGATNMMLREHFQLQENRSTSFSRAMLALPPSNDAHNTSSAKFKETEAGCGHEIDENSDSSRFGPQFPVSQRLLLKTICHDRGTIHGPAALLSRSAALSQAVLLPEDAEGSGVEESLPGDIYDVNGQQIDCKTLRPLVPVLAPCALSCAIKTILFIVAVQYANFIALSIVHFVMYLLHCAYFVGLDHCTAGTIING